MYHVKRLIEQMLDVAEGPAVEAELDRIGDLAREAVDEINRELQEQIDGPQEMRDLFAAAALLKVNADTKERLVERC